MGKTHPGLAFSLGRSVLLPALSAVLKVTETRVTIPILGHVLITVRAGSVSVRSADLTCEASATVPAEVACEGSLTVPAHQFHDLLKSLPDGARVEIALTENGRLSVKAGRSRFHLPTLQAAEFPSLEANPEEAYTRFSLPGLTLANAIAQVQHAISTEETRYYLNGIYLHPFAASAEATSLRLVASDGHRLSMVDLGAVEGVEFNTPGVIIARKACDLMKRMGEAAGDAPLGLTISRSLIRVEQGDVVLISRVIDGTFPAYDRIIPYANPHRATMPTRALSGACERVALLSTEEKATERSITFAFNEAVLTCSITNHDGTDAVDEIDIEHDGPPLSIKLNPKLLAAVLAAVGADTVTLALDEPGSPVLFRHGDAGALHVLMPMRR